MSTTTDLTDFGIIEREYAIELLQAMNNSGLPKDFDADEVQLIFNADSGIVFLTNSRNQTAVKVGSDLVSYYTLPSGKDGLFIELAIDYTDHTEADKAELRAIAEQNNLELYEIISTEYEPDYGQHYQVIRLSDQSPMSGEECSLDDCEQLVEQLLEGAKV